MPEYIGPNTLTQQKYLSNRPTVTLASRTRRIFPLYFLIVGIFVCISVTPIFTSPSFKWLFYDPLPIWSYASFTQNIFMGLRGDFGANWLCITWSLAVEEHFYLFLPILVYHLPRRALVCVLVLAIFGAIVLRFAFPGFGAFVNTPWRSDSLLSGALLAALVRWHPFVSHVRRNRNFVFALLIALLAGAGVLTFRPDSFGAFNLLWLAGLYSTLILIAFIGNDLFFGRILGSPVLVWFGQLSYGIYMFHQAVSGLLDGSLRQQSPQIRTLSDAAITLTALCITLALAMLSYRFFETPFLRLGHRFPYLPQIQRSSIPQTVPSPP